MYKSDAALTNSLESSEANSTHLRSPTLVRNGQIIVPLLYLVIRLGHVAKHSLGSKVEVHPESITDGGC